ncbi:MAG TPA: zinc ribbon domain-containing protein [Candidatus Binatia bacterium]|jgi:putative FmdB family regulatory protein
MPIYEYRCSKCGQFEIVQRITEPVLKRCPTCQAKVTKLISTTSFQLKGTGWYITDYGRKDSGNTTGKAGKEASETKAESSTASATSTKSEKSEKSEKPSKSTESAAA